MRCPACGGETPDGKRFCANCGSSLAAACVVCGAELLLGKAFCADCGTPVNPQAAAPRPGAVAGTTASSGAGVATEAVAERRICSVLFVDLVGFTPLAEKRDAEQIRELLSLYFERAQTIIGHYGGTVEKFIGDAVMAVWGAPVANEDDAERAVRAGLEVVVSVSELGRAWEIPELAARGGVVTGEVAITVGRVAEGMVLGDTVNSASRVQSVASPGTVLVDESTFRAASSAIAFRDVGVLTLKGKEEPVHAWEALRVVAQRRGVGRSEGLEPPFVGRDVELRLVKDLLHATANERRARLVSVTGVPGIGKSRLAWEFLKYVDGLVDTVYWHQGRSPAYGEGITFWALAEMVRMRAGITESEEAASARQKLADSVERFVGDPEERRWVEPRLAHLLGLVEAPGGDRQELFSAWRTFFERIADENPTVMVFEDLQWADPGLVDFVESILEWSRNHPILVVTLSRPELVDRRPTWGAGQRNFTALHLDPLPPAEMRQLLRGLVRELPADMAETILGRSEGVPLYAVEMIRALVDRGVLTEADGAYQVTGDLEAFEIPETLHALIGARLDALPPEQRSLLQDAAILGTTFSTSSLAAVQGVQREKLDADLRDLVRKEFLVLDTDVRSPERGQYGFVQALIQEVASARLARRDRSAKHLAVARHFESLQDDELAAAIAAHYLEAFRALPDGAEAEFIAGDARSWLSRAGERALSLGSPEQALRFFEEALEVTEGDERAGLLVHAGHAAESSGDLARAVALLEQAIRDHRSQGDVLEAHRATVRIVGNLAAARRYSEALERGQAAFDEWAGLDDPVRADLATEMSMVRAQIGQPEEALGWIETALSLAERSDDTTTLARAIGAKAMILYNLGRHREAVILQRGSSALADAAGGLREQVASGLALSVYVIEDDPKAAMAASRSAAELARRAGQRGLEMMNLLNWAESASYLGERGETEQALEQASLRELNPEHTVWSDCIRAVLAALGGDAERAHQLVVAHADAAATEYVHMQATYLGAKSFVALLAGDLEGAIAAARHGVAADPMGINAVKCAAVQARACLWNHDVAGARDAVSALVSFRGRWTAAARTTFEAGLALLEGRPEEGLEGYRAAFGAWRALDCRLDLALAELDLLLLGGEERHEREAVEAREIFAAMQLPPLLERVPGFEVAAAG